MPIVIGELGHVIRDWADLDWVVFQGHDGVRLCAIQVDERYETTVVAMDYSGHFQIESHWHPVAHLEVVLDGELLIDGKLEPAGSFRFVPADTPYSISAGPDGAKVLEIFPSHHAEDVGGHYVDPDLAARLNENPERMQRMSELLGLKL